MATPVKDLRPSGLGDLATKRVGAYPAGTAFIESETPGIERVLLRYIREGRPVVIVFPGDEEVFVEARRSWERRPGSKLLRSLRRRRGSLSSS
jgi:hypothetical protein